MLHVHRAERADGLVDALRELLAAPPDDPFAREVVSVPTRGIERWLAQRLSGRLGTSPGQADGVCANVAFPAPRALIGEAVAAASGIEPGADPWLPERAVWPLLDIVDAALGEPWLAHLAAHLAGDEARRFAAVQHVAQLFDRYALHRPEMVRGWAEGADAGAWQAELWRRLDARLDVAGPAARLESACAALRERPELADLPERLALFGLTRLPAGHLEVLAALAARREVHLFLLHPSPALWQRVGSAIAGAPPARRRAEDPTARFPRNRLLASWGQDVRELQLVVAAAGEQVDHHHPVAAAPRGSLLARLQAAVREDAPPPAEPAALDPGDRSVQVHACHGRSRQVEVVRDAVLHLLADDPTLEPRDVIVMCPDVEAFAPLVHATFGAGEAAGEDEEEPAGSRPPDLRVRLADRSLRQTNPVLGVVARLLELADQRLTASQVLDLADREPVRRRFRLDDDAVARIEGWVAAGGIRWGLDAAHRAPFRLDSLEAGTWRAGLDRILLGVAMPEAARPLFAGVLPLDGVDSRAIELAGRLAELVDRLRQAVDELTGPQTVDAWAAAIARAADALCAAPALESWQRAQLQRLLDDAVREAGGSTAELALAEVRALLADRLKGRPTRANFRTGHLTVCTLVPMRSVPHRVVCLVGLDDGAFPRRTSRDGDDLVLEDPHLGDRDPRTEDRQMLLDALLAATDRLIVTYTGKDERTNTPRPPAVPVGELLDMADATARPAGGGRARDRIVVHHPLQPFDPRSFTPGRLVAGRPWSFDRVMLDGARAMSGDRAEPRGFLEGPLPADPAPLLGLDDLVAFAEHPVRAFLDRRLGVRVGLRDDEVEDALPVQLDGLRQWRVGQRLLDGRLAGASLEDGIAAEVARGELPPGRLALPVIAAVRPVVEAIALQAATALGGLPEPEPVDVRVALPGGRSLRGTVSSVRGDVVAAVNYSRVSARHRLAMWVRWLALTAAHPDRPFEAVVIGRADAPDAVVTIARIPPLGPDASIRGTVARRQLATLVDLYDRGMREPLPLACLASAAYASAAERGLDAAAAGRRAWQSDRFDKEDRDAEHQLVHGGVVDFGALLAALPGEDECGEGWDEADETRFGRYARRLWAPLLAIEAVEHRE